MARTHGWGGDAPASDADAIERIVRVAGEIVDAGATAPTILEVARRLGVTRQTVYRYFTGPDELLTATADRASAELLQDLSVELRGVTDASEAVVIGIATSVERMRANRRFLLFFTSDTQVRALGTVTSTPAIALARSIVEQCDVDWSGWSDRDLDELAEHMLRTVQTFILDPGRPARTGETLRAYLRRWVSPAVLAPPMTLA